MEWDHTCYVLILFVCVIATFWVAVYAWRQRASVGASLALILLEITIWSLGCAVAIRVYDLAGRIWWETVQHLGIALASVAMATFVIGYSGHAVWLMSALPRAHTRQMDVACRFGGEEFVLIMPGALDEVAARHADQWPKAVEA